MSIVGHNPFDTADQSFGEELVDAEISNGTVRRINQGVLNDQERRRRRNDLRDQQSEIDGQRQAQDKVQVLEQARQADRLQRITLEDENEALRKQNKNAKDAIVYLLNRSSSLRQTIEHLAAGWGDEEVASVHQTANDLLEHLENDADNLNQRSKNADVLIQNGVAHKPHTPFTPKRASSRKPKR